jgi:hypothetical protein
MRWYFWISNPYMMPLRGYPSWPCEREAIIEEQDELAGPLTIRLESKLTAIRGIANRGEENYTVVHVLYGELSEEGGGPATQ